jgi:hypothetical protein
LGEETLTESSHPFFGLTAELQFRRQTARTYDRITVFVAMLCVAALAIVLATAGSAEAQGRKIPCTSVSKRLHEGPPSLPCRIPSGFLAPRLP